MSASHPAHVLPSTADSAELVRALIRQHTPVSFQAGGQSMEPTIRDGEVVRIRPVKPADFRAGAILLFQRPGRMILHRLVKLNRAEAACWFVSDAGALALERVSADAVLGAAEWVVRNGQDLRLDTPAARKAGMLRYQLRSLRQRIGKLRRLRRG